MTQSKTKFSNKRYTSLAIIIAIIAISSVILIRFSDDLFGPPSPYPGVDKPGSLHFHADFKVYIDGKQVQFSPRKNPSYALGNEYIFLEEKNGNTIHIFAKGAFLEMFFDGLGMKFDKNCFVLDETNNNGRYEENVYCEEGEKKMLFYVNDEPNDQYEKYVPFEEDRILIAYGKYDERDIDIMLKTLVSIPFVMPGG